MVENKEACLVYCQPFLSHTFMKYILAALFFLTSPALAQDEASDGVSLALAGDVMLGSDYNGGILPSRMESVMEEAAPYLRQADVAIVNLEGAISTHPISGKQGCGKCYAFRMPPQAAEVLKHMGVDGVSIANNHARDFGQQGLIDTVAHLARNNIGATGVAGQDAIVFQHNNTRVGLLAFAPNSGMNDVRSLPLIASKVGALKKSVDLVVVSFHIGAEGAAATHVRPGTEFYLGENRGDVMAASRAAIDAGADVVFGHGPHVPRALDVYKGKLIAYSLGNFATHGGFSLDGALGYAPLLWVEFDRNHQLRCAKIVSFVQKRPGGVQLDPQQRALHLMWNRTLADAPDGAPHVQTFFNTACSQ